MNKLAALTINIAGSQLGVKEATGHNDGPAVEGYLKAIGLKPGYPWCMAFLYWCVEQAAAQLKMVNPLKCTGGVQDQYDSRPAIHISVPVPGCIYILKFKDGWHCGLVTGVFKNGLIHGIEGNTNDNGSREGTSVLRKWRDVKDKAIIGYLKLEDKPL